MFDNHIWRITVKNVCISNNTSVISYFYALISVSAPKIGQALIPLDRFDFTA